jgi:hypothetical protein
LKILDPVRLRSKILRHMEQKPTKEVKSKKIATLKGKLASDVREAIGTEGLVYDMTPKGRLDFYKEVRSL